MNCLRGKLIANCWSKSIVSNTQWLQTKRFISVGKTLINSQLAEGSPNNSNSILSLLKNDNKSLLVGVPGAFSPGCTESHIPAYIKQFDNLTNKTGISKVYVIAVNDAFVMKAWKEKFFSNNDKLIDNFTFLADATGEFTEKNELLFDATKFFGNPRSKRYALLVDSNGLVLKSFVEPDNVSVNVSSAENVIKVLSK